MKTIKYKFIKKILNSIYRVFSGTHIELEKAKLYEKLLQFGKDSNIEFPYKINRPENVSIGNSTTILEGARLDTYLVDEKYGKIIIGNNCYIGYGFSAISGGDILLGDYILIASDVTIVSHNHGMNPEGNVSYMHQELGAENVTIGDGCWIGEKVQIMPGVSVGKKSIIAAGAIVTRDIPDYSIVAGVPAKVIKKYNFNKHCWEKVV